MFVGIYKESSLLGETPRHDRVKNHVQRPAEGCTYCSQSLIHGGIKPNILIFFRKMSALKLAKSLLVWAEVHVLTAIWQYGSS